MAEGAERRAPAVLRAWRWIWEPSERTLHVDSCPRCGSTVVVVPAKAERDPSEALRPLGSALDRLKPAPRPDEGQLLAACVEHGWAPYNERSRRLRRRRRPDD